MDKKVDSGVRKTWVWIWAPELTTCVTLGTFATSQFTHLWNGDNKVPLEYFVITKQDAYEMIWWWCLAPIRADACYHYTEKSQQEARAFTLSHSACCWDDHVSITQPVHFAIGITHRSLLNYQMISTKWGFVMDFIKERMTFQLNLEKRQAGEKTLFPLSLPYNHKLGLSKHIAS